MALFLVLRDCRSPGRNAPNDLMAGDLLDDREYDIAAILGAGCPVVAYDESVLGPIRAAFLSQPRPPGAGSILSLLTAEGEIPGVDQGRFVPTLTAIANISSFSAVVPPTGKYLRVNDLVSVWFTFDCTPTVGGVGTQATHSLPPPFAAVDFTSFGDLCGAGVVQELNSNSGTQSLVLPFTTTNQATNAFDSMSTEVHVVAGSYAYSIA